MQALCDKLLKTDVIVLGNSTYFDNITALMKIFIDRWFAPLSFREIKR